jgi:hypothetical protein
VRHEARGSKKVKATTLATLAFATVSALGCASSSIAYMTMGEKGMGGMGDMEMPIPKNSLPMRGGKGPFGTIDMGGMFTVLKVREEPNSADPNGWYTHPAGTVPGRADAARMQADGVKVP